MTYLGVSLLVLAGTLALVACRAWGRERRQAEQDRQRTADEREDARLDRIQRRRGLGLPDDDERRQR